MLNRCLKKMKTISVIFICFIIVQIHVAVGEKDSLHVCALVERTQHRYSKYYAFFIDILEHAFGEIVNWTDMLPEYSLKLIPKDTQVI